MKLDENIKESETLRQKGDALKNTLADYEDIIDKRINELQKEANTSTKLLADIEPKFKNFNKSLLEMDNRSKEYIQETRVELSNETKQLIDLMRREVDNAFVANVEKIAEFEQAVQNLRADNELAFSEKERQILSLISTTQNFTANLTEIETKIQSYDQKQKAIVENLLITSEAQMNEIRNKYDSRIAELITRYENYNDKLESTEIKIADMNVHSNKMEEDLFHSQRDIEELKRNGSS